MWAIWPHRCWPHLPGKNFTTKDTKDTKKKELSSLCPLCPLWFKLISCRYCARSHPHRTPRTDHASADSRPPFLPRRGRRRHRRRCDRPGPRLQQKRQPARYPDADIIVLDKRFASIKIGNAAIERLYTGHALGRRAGLERRGPLCRLERHSQQRANALAQRRWPRQQIPRSLALQQRQHIRLRGPADLLRAWHPHASSRYEHNGKRTVLAEQVQRQTPQCSQRRRRPSRRRHLVHRSRLRHPDDLRGRTRRRWSWRRPSIASIPRPARSKS